MPKNENENVLGTRVQDWKRLQGLLKRVIAILEAAENGRALKAQELLVKSPQAFSELAADLRRIVEESITAKAIEALDKAIADAWGHYKTELEAALSREQIPFSGSWPVYFLHSLIKLEIDRANNKVELNERRLKSADIDKVVNLAKKLISQLLERPFDPVQWGTVIQDICDKPDTKTEFVDIRVIRKALRERYGKNYSDQHLAIDLLRLIQASREGQVPMKIEVSSARNPKGAIYLPGANGGFVSGLRAVSV
jgi:hypothetical protein